AGSLCLNRPTGLPTEVCRFDDSKPCDHHFPTSTRCLPWGHHTGCNKSHFPARPDSRLSPNEEHPPALFWKPLPSREPLSNRIRRKKCRTPDVCRPWKEQNRRAETFRLQKTC